MSIRQFRPRGNNRRSISSKKSAVLNVLAILAVALQISYPLVHGDTLSFVTIATVYCAAATMLLHAQFAYGSRFSISFLILTFSYSLAVELIGSKTGWPFGKYHYEQSLGFSISGVPIVVPFAWIMLSYPLLIAARKVGKSWVFLYGGVGLMAWDLFLDPQMVSAHRWSWEMTGRRVPFEPMIPLSNSVGWLLAGMGLMGALHGALPKERRKYGAPQTVPNFFLAWTLFAGVVGNLVFFHRPGVALIGGIVFGILLLPYFFELRFGRPDSF